MFVCAGTFNNGSTLPAGTTLGTFDIPTWIYNKIYPVWGNFIEKKTLVFIDSAWGEQTKDFCLEKPSSTGTMRILTPSTVALQFTSTKSYRIQFDLLIDME